MYSRDINPDTFLTENELESNLQLYFDGLMSVVNKDKGIKIRKTSALLQKKEDTNTSNRYSGKVRVYDAFKTKNPITLNVLVDQYYCEKTKRFLIVFRFSPKEFGNDVWIKLKQVKLRTDACDA